MTRHYVRKIVSLHTHTHSLTTITIPQRVKRIIDEKIVGLVASKVKLTGKKFIFGDLNDKASKTLKGIHLKRGKKELKKKRRFAMAEKIEAELAALRRGD